MALNAQQHDPAVLTPQNEPRVPVKHEAGRVGEEKNSLHLPGNRNTIPRLPSLQCSHVATALSRRNSIRILCSISFQHQSYGFEIIQQNSFLCCVIACLQNRLLMSINLLTPNVNYSGRTALLTSRFAFYIFIQQIQVLNILNMVYTLRFFLSSKCSLFHNSNVFGSCIIHILYTGCAKIKKIIPAPKG